MLLGTALTINHVLIRLTDERFIHILYSHPEIAPTDFPKILDTIENPDLIAKGRSKELIAVKAKEGRKKAYFVVVYKEISQTDGFVITAYITTDSQWLLKKELIWIKQS